MLAVAVLDGRMRLEVVVQLKKRCRVCRSRTCCLERGIAEAPVEPGSRLQRGNPVLVVCYVRYQPNQVVWSIVPPQG